MFKTVLKIHKFDIYCCNFFLHLCQSMELGQKFVDIELKALELQSAANVFYIAGKEWHTSRDR